jgi:hypothetical protein
MSTGIRFQKFVEELRAIEFPVHRVTGGDIHLVVTKKVDTRDAIFLLHQAAETRRMVKQQPNRSLS